MPQSVACPAPLSGYEVHSQEGPAGGRAAQLELVGAGADLDDGPGQAGGAVRLLGPAAVLRLLSLPAAAREREALFAAPESRHDQKFIAPHHGAGSLNGRTEDQGESLQLRQQELLEQEVEQPAREIKQTDQ